MEALLGARGVGSQVPIQARAQASLPSLDRGTQAPGSSRYTCSQQEATDRNKKQQRCSSRSHGAREEELELDERKSSKSNVTEGACTLSFVDVGFTAYNQSPNHNINPTRGVGARDN